MKHARAPELLLVERDRHQRVRDLACREERARVLPGHHHHTALLVRVERGLAAGARAERYERVAAVVLERGVRLDRSERAPLARSIAGLLEQLALSGIERRLSRIDDAARDLQR